MTPPAALRQPYWRTTPTPTGKGVYLIGYDTLGWQTGSDWRYALPDALGSVRQETDGAGAVIAVREWSPYGEEVGAARAGLGFTGEWFDAVVGLQYLRARWYQPGTGRFTSRDPWEGKLSQPKTILCPYWYGLMNPITIKDTSGAKPERGFPYSCNCGFIDESHFDASPDSMAAQIIQRVRDAEVSAPFDLPPLPNGKPVNLPIIGEFWVGQEVNRQVLIKQELTIEEKQEVALGIFQAVEDASEQGWAQTLAGSRYSEEDLISNLLGFYYALGGEYTLENIKLWCGYLDEKKSIEVYDWYEKNLGFTKMDEWGKPRLATCANKRSGCGFLWLAKCPVCPLDKYCSEERIFPVDKFDIEPEPEGNKWEFVDPKPARFIIW